MVSLFIDSVIVLKEVMVIVSLLLSIEGISLNTEVAGITPILGITETLAY